MRENQTPPLTPCSRAVNMRSVQTVGSAQVRGPVASPTCLAAGTVVGCGSIGLFLSLPPSCVPWLDRRYPASSLLWTLWLLRGGSSGLGAMNTGRNHAGLPSSRQRLVVLFRLQPPPALPDGVAGVDPLPGDAIQ